MATFGNGSVGSTAGEASTTGGSVESVEFDDAAGSVVVDEGASEGEDLRESSRTVLQTKSMF